MNAIIRRGYGTPSVLSLATVQAPTPGPEEVLVAVHRSSVTQADIAFLTGSNPAVRLFAGLRRPRQPIPGFGVAGVVVAVGDKMSDLSPGDRVYGSSEAQGALAEQICMPRTALRPLPDFMSFADAIGAIEAHTALWFVKYVADVQPGQKVLVIGASGAVGTGVVQVARHLGARVTGVCSGRNAELVRRLGAEDIVDYTQQDLTELPNRYDLIVDCVGDHGFPTLRRLLRPEGQLLTAVMSAQALLWSVLTRFGAQRCRLPFAGLNQDPEHYEVLEAMMADGALQPVIDREVPLDQVPEAFRYVQSGRKRGVLLVSVA